ncbi:N-6 DNA methylase [Actinophytocola sp. KF-1]
MPGGHDTTLVGLADVAKLAGVTRPAVSNWRRRHDDFPAPVRETGAVSLFSLPEIRAWLAEHGKGLAPPSARAEVAAALNRVRGAVTVTSVVEMCLKVLAVLVTDENSADHDFRTLVGRGEELVGDDLSRGWLADPDDVANATPMLASLPRLVSEHGAVAVCEALLAEAADQERRAPWLLTAPGLVDLVLALAEPHLRGTVYDPACGLGTLLMAAHERAGDRVELVGDNENRRAHMVATLRALIHGVPVTLHGADGWAHRRTADVVLAAAPATHDTGAAMVWWTARSLNPGGHGFTVSPRPVLVRGGEDRRIRAELVRDGMVEAVVELPPGLYDGTTARSALWLLRPRGGARSDVLLVDASGASVRREARPELDKHDIAAVVATVRTWRAHGKPEPTGFPAVVVARSRLMTGECRMDVASWTEPDDAADVVERFGAALSRISRKADELAAATLPPELVVADVDRRPVHELVRAGDAELLRGVRLPPARIGRGGTPVVSEDDLQDDWTARVTVTADVPASRRDLPLTRRGDVLISVSDQRVRAAVVEQEGAVVLAPLQCLRLRRSSAARARVIAAQLSGGRDPVRYSEVRNLDVRWPSDDECARIARMLDHVAELRRTAAEAADAAEALTSGALAALSAGAIPVPDRWEAP